MDEPHEARTLGEACQNEDGTYNGVRLMQWLFSAMTGGKIIHEDEVRAAWEAAKRKREPH